jgi:RHS repeat-associated protein
MTTRTEGGLAYTQVFDTENQLTSITVGGQVTQFIYDPDGNMVKKIKPDGSKTLYISGVYEVDKTSGGTVTQTRTYYPAAGAMRIGGTLYFMLKDHLGSASVLTDASGTAVLGADTRYYPFGEARFSTTPMLTDKLFTGQREITGLGIYHYGARFYSPYIHRFLSADTIVPGYANPQSLNRYSYVLNNPLRYTDPLGHRPDDGCRTGEGCNVSAQTLIDDNRRANDFRNTTERNKCKAGNKNSCSYAENHPVETVTFLGGGLLLTGTGAASLSYMSAADAAATINVGINVTTDYLFARLSNKPYSLQDGATTALFSLLIGSAGGMATQYFGTATAGPAAKTVIAQAAIQLIGNTAHRLVEGKATGPINGEMDFLSAALSATLQITVDADPYVLSHAGEAVSSLLQAMTNAASEP